MNSRVLFVAALLVGCNGGGEADTVTVIPPDFGDDDDDTADTASGNDYLSADQIRFIGYIAWDSVLGEIINPTTIDGGEGNQSAYVIRIGTSDYDSQNPDTFCEVKINMEGYVAVDDLGVDYVWGVDIPQSDAGTGPTSDCISRGWDPDDFEGESAIGQWANYDYHLRIGGTLSAELEEWLTPDDTSDFDINRYSAGTWWTDEAGLNGGDDDIYFYGYYMDEEGNVDTDIQLDRFDLLNDDLQLRTGYYLARMSVYWNISG
jgi:hypothetical protein